MKHESRRATRAALGVVCLLASAVVAGAQTVPEPWSARDIGQPVLAGASDFSSGVFRIDAAGEDVWGLSDQFHFVYQAFSGDVDIRARVESVAMAHTWSKAGVMIRGSLDADAPHGYVLVSAGKGSAFQRRQVRGGMSVSTGRPALAPPHWVRLTRAGTAVTAYTSTDGQTWAPIATDTVALGGTVYVGIGVTSHHPGMRTVASVSNVSIRASAPPPLGELPGGESSVDIGAPAIAGSTLYSSGQYTIRASGADIWDSHDQFHFVSRPVSGDLDVIARVASLSAADSWSKAGVMIRESLAPGSRHAFALTSVAKGFAFQRRAQTDAWSEHTSGGAGAPPGWVRLTRRGDVISAYRSADGVGWTTMGSATITMDDTVYVGLAVTSHSNSTPTTAVVDRLQITAPRESSFNEPPAVLLSAPSSGSSYTAPASLTLTASATDPDGAISGVDFYANGTLLGRDTSAPYAVTGSLTVGTYTITAVATDMDGASTVSAAATISVLLAQNPEPDPEPDPDPVPAGEDPRLVVFTVSDDHDALVIRYVLEVYSAGATPGIDGPLATSDLGKPTPMLNGDVIVDRAAFFQALAPGGYVAAVLAVGGSGSARSESVPFAR